MIRHMLLRALGRGSAAGTCSGKPGQNFLSPNAWKRRV